jgi:hypothetical protein
LLDGGNCGVALIGSHATRNCRRRKGLRFLDRLN